MQSAGRIPGLCHVPCVPTVCPHTCCVPARHKRELICLHHSRPVGHLPADRAPSRLRGVRPPGRAADTGLNPGLPPPRDTPRRPVPQRGPRTTSEHHSLTAWALSTLTAEPPPRRGSCLHWGHMPWGAPHRGVGSPRAATGGSSHLCPHLADPALSTVSKERAWLLGDGHSVARIPANQERTEQADAPGLSLQSCPPGLFSASLWQLTQEHVCGHGTCLQRQRRTGSCACEHTDALRGTRQNTQTRAHPQECTGTRVTPVQAHTTHT